MTTLAAELTFPDTPITSLQKRMSKGLEQLYYASLFLKSAAYKGPEIWRSWLEQGFHVTIFSPPRGTAPGDRIRVRVKAASTTPVMSVEGSNADALKDLESLVQVIDGLRPGLAGKGDDARVAALREGALGRQLVGPLTETLQGNGFEAEEIDEYLAMLQRGFDALTNDDISAIELTLS